MKVIIAGGTGFVGKAIVKGLLDDGHQVIILVRPSSRTTSPEHSGVEIVSVDLENPISASDISGDAIINLIGIIRENKARGSTFHKSHYWVTKYLIDFAKRNQIGQYLQMSALGAKPNAKTSYEQTKFAAECYIRESGLNWTIYRPSIIIGPDGGLIQMLTNMMRKLPFVPVVGNGQYKVQPIYIEDVIAGFRKALGNNHAKGKVFEIGGPEIITFNQFIDNIGDVLGCPKVRKWHQPIWMLRLITAFLERFQWFPLTNDQITMLLENNYTEDRSYFEFFGITPRNLKEALSESIR